MAQVSHFTGGGVRSILASAYSRILSFGDRGRGGWLCIIIASDTLHSFQ
jgi:hypothetical protein